MKYTCDTCKKDFHPKGIGRHIAMHRDKSEHCQVYDPDGQLWDYAFNLDNPRK